MEQEELLEEMFEQNTWWDGKEPEIPEKNVEREVFRKTWEKIGDERVLTIVGLRRVGKTTLLMNTVKRILKETEPRNIMYFSFDLFQPEPRELLNLYEEEVLKKPFKKLEDTAYILLDEIQKVENWGDQIKSFQEKYDIKFILTGSSSMNVTKGAGESLVGRTEIMNIGPFSFREYLKYKDLKPPEKGVENISYPENSKSLKIAFNDYMEKGGFPELYEDFSEDYLSQMLDLVFFRDIVELFPVKRTKVLKGVFQYLSENTGQKIRYNKISKDLNTQYNTIKNYLEYLENSFLISRSYPETERTLKKLRKNPKIYIADHAYNNLFHTKQGLKAETIAYNHLKNIEEPGFHEKPEIDILLPERKQAFEVKYTKKISENDMKNLTELPEDYHLNIITKKEYGKEEVEGRTVRKIPLWLLCSKIS